MLEKYPKEIKLVHKFIPAHDFTMKASIAALAADDQGKFREFHDQLFANQRELDDTKIIEIAAMLKLNMDRFRKKMADPALKAIVDRDNDDAKKLGITRTPWIYINGRHLSEHSLTGFTTAIDAELSR